MNFLFEQYINGKWILFSSNKKIKPGYHIRIPQPDTAEKNDYASRPYQQSLNLPEQG